jgi:hypothetical protein
MKLNVIALALAASAFAFTAQAQDVVVKEKVAPGVVVKERVGTPKVVVKERATVGVRSSDCTTKTVKRTNEVTDRTKVVKRTRCD